jgi:hypothetical protein
MLFDNLIEMGFFKCSYSAFPFSSFDLRRVVCLHNQEDLEQDERCE